MEPSGLFFAPYSTHKYYTKIPPKPLTIKTSGKVWVESKDDIPKAVQMLKDYFGPRINDTLTEKSSGKHDYPFVAAAIKFESGGHTLVITGKRHHEILKKIKEIGLTGDYKKHYEDGFIYRTTTGLHVFKERDECTEIAKRLNIEMIGSVLTSEDLW